MLTIFAVTSAVAYLLGSIPFGLVLVRVFRGMDVRQTGSGNIGTANVARLAPGLGAWTLILDSAKGYIAVLIAVKVVAHFPAITYEWWSVPLIMGSSALFAVLGHMFSVFLSFKGGKGVATAMGAYLGISPLAVVITFVLYALIYYVSHYTSLASIVSAALFPAIAGATLQVAERRVLLPFLVAIGTLIIAKHHENIRRLVAGTENRLYLGRH